MPTRTFVTLACYALAITGWSSIDVTTVRAQPLGRTVVVPYFVGDAENSAIELARETDAALRARRAEVISLHDARDRFNARSREPRSASASDVDALAKEANMAMEHVAFGRTAAAQRSVQQIVELAERSLETLNRETARARTLLDACLSLVRASLHDNKRDEAIEQAMNCRRLVPDLAPSTTAHPATVIGALAEADDQLRRMHVGSLAVQVEPQRPCDVYLNGRLLGHTPFALEKARREITACRSSAELGRQHAYISCGSAMSLHSWSSIAPSTSECVPNRDLRFAIHRPRTQGLRSSRMPLPRGAKCAPTTSYSSASSTPNPRFCAFKSGTNAW